MKLTTKEMEHLIYRYLWKQGTYLCFEVMMPDTRGRYMYNNERVDLLSYETKGYWRFYELKLTKSDFHSTSKVTFLGHYNYYVMPIELYQEVKDEIPSHVGVYAVYTRGNYHYISGCTKRAKKQELQVDSNLLMFSFMQALSRENQKYRKILSREFDKQQQKELIKREEKEQDDDLWNL